MTSVIDKDVIPTIRYQIESESFPTTAEIKSAIDLAISKFGDSLIFIDFLSNDYHRTSASCIMSCISTRYGAGIMISFYGNPTLQKVTLTNGSVSLSSLS